VTLLNAFITGFFGAVLITTELALAGCSTKSGCMSLPQTTLDRRTGLPVEPAEGKALLREAPPDRSCQFAIYPPPPMRPHAVWLNYTADKPAATSFVAVLSDTGEAVSYFAQFEPRAVIRLSQLCKKAVSILQDACVNPVRDGIWYYMAEADSNGEYAAAIAISPHQGSVGHAAVSLAEALRDYTTAPDLLKLEQWRRVQDAESELFSAIGE